MFEEYWNHPVGPFFTLGDIVLAALVLVFAFLFRKLFARLVLNRLKKIATKNEATLDNKILAALEPPLKFIFIVVAFYLAMLMLKLPAEIFDKLTPLIRSLVAFTLFWALYRSVEPLSFLIDRLAVTFGAELAQALKNLFIKGLKILIILIGFTAILNEWGVNVMSLLAGFGIAGVAVAFAAKESLANIFASLTIIFDKMFKPGDWIMTPDVEGTVEEIGSRSTKIRTFAKALVTVPNAKLANSAVTNWSEMTNRRIKMRLALEYRTSSEQITRIMQRIKDYLQTHQEIETDSPKVATLVNLVEFNDSSIDILLYYFTKTTRWQEWLRIREENMLEFIKIVEEEGAAFAFPSQQIYMEKLPSDFPKLVST
jgi:MscS family membrane protein